MNKLDPFNLQVVSFYLKSKRDFLNIIQVNKKYRFLLDRFRINPIKITNETQGLFKYLDTQQLFGKRNKRNSAYGDVIYEQIEDEEEVILINVKVIQYNYPITYNSTKKIKKEIKDRGVKFKKISYIKANTLFTGTTISKEVNVISERCFSEYQLETIEIPTTITEIQDYCFWGCVQLQEIKIPDSVIKIGKHCFGSCSSLTKVELSTNIVELNKSIFSECASLREIILPPYLTRINKNCFCGCDINEIEIPMNVERIGKYCFNECTNLKKIVIKDVKDVGIGCFMNCSKLEEMNLNDEIISLENYCFSRCQSLTKINIPTKLERIGNECFKECSSLSSIKIPKSVTYIGDECFYGCKELKRMEIENKEIKIGYDAFGECLLLEEIIIGNKKITVYPFEVNYSQMKHFEKIGILSPNVVIRQDDVKEYGVRIMNDNRVHQIQSNCFQNNLDLQGELVIPIHITQLGSYSFSNCKKLTKVVIPKSIKTIPDYCFEYCSSLFEVEIPERVQMRSGCFFQCLNLSEKSKEMIPSHCF